MTWTFKGSTIDHLSGGGNAIEFQGLLKRAVSYRNRCFEGFVGSGIGNGDSNGRFNAGGYKGSWLGAPADWGWGRSQQQSAT
ncbi:hypothetical protein [Leptothermofonsia sp. ETS-13]|uniref:hypothetical protein n=1 Tax=Leptothermofonsia sp. ETS-13 TaxID=3035696 RepID=UPI003BA32378